MTDPPVETKRTYQCEGCDATFTGDAHTAFMEGWDTPERFMSHCTCPNCPITCTIWWKVVILKQEPTAEEFATLVTYNQWFEEANQEVKE